MTHALRTALIGACALPLLVACGSGGGAESPAIIAPPPPGVATSPAGPVYQAGVFPPSSQFRNQCATVRTDNTPDGNPRADQRGELIDELFWIRSWMNETYLYWEEMNDVDPSGFSDRQAYFDEVVTDVRTAAGPLLDRFSFTQTTEAFEARSSGAPVFGYGASLAVLQNSGLPRDWRISFTQEGSNAETAGLTRGARLLTIDGADFLNGTSPEVLQTLNDGLFPDSVGEEHVFGVRYPDGTEADITVVSQSITIEPVQDVRIIQDADRRVGYVHYQTFGPRTGEAQLLDAFTTLSRAGVDDVVLDFRYNGGGLLALAAQLGYMVAGDQSLNRVFYAQEFQSRAPNTNPISGRRVAPIDFIPETVGFSVDAGRPLPSLDLPRVFILTTSRSCSASEAVLNGLNGIGVDAFQIGTRTCGKATGQIPLDNCGITYVPLHFRGVNAEGFGDFDGGFAPNEITGDNGPVIPGCEVEDDFSNPLGDENEALLAAALSFARGDGCPADATATASKDANGPLGAESMDFVGSTLDDPLMQMPGVRAYMAQQGVLDMSGTALADDK